MAVISRHPCIKQTQEELTERAWEKDYNSRALKAKNPLKIKPKDLETFPACRVQSQLNPSLRPSTGHVMELPRIESTKTGQYATGAKVIKALLNYVDTDSHTKLLQSLIDYAKAEKILGTFHYRI